MKPVWTNADEEIDVSDVWVEECDPENERGELVTAYIINGALEGLSIYDGSTTIYRDRIQAAQLIGLEAIYRIEQICPVWAAE